MKSLNIVIIGVGGQGTLLASRILGALAMEAETGVKVSEVHGMSQRGGSVVTYVRIGADVHSPMVEAGTADYVLAFEKVEALRAASFLKKGGTMIVNDQRIDPMPVITGAAVYPDDALELLRAQNIDVLSLDALKLASAAGEPRAVNLVLLGVLCKISGGVKEDWLRAIEHSVPERFRSVNLDAFEAGYAQ